MPDKPKLKPKPERKLDTEVEKSKIIGQAETKPEPKRRSENPSATQTPQQKSPKKQCIHIEFADAKDVPLMFQAQIPDRGNIQYVGDDSKNKNQEREKKKPAYERWVMQWIDGCPPKPEKVDEKHHAMQRYSPKSTVKLPQFGSHVKTWEYQIRWRMVTNGGQDEGLIRPVIGAKGMPFFPGSSMKGAFWRSCPKDKRQRYCGGEITVKGEKRTKPGILRFHGGYPVDMSWAQRDRLVDIAHGQQSYQIMRNTKEKGENANVQISLYKPKFKFGISSMKILEDSEWEEIKNIWEKALGCGIGSRVSAGYGYVDRVNRNGSVKPIENSDHILLSIHLNGEGLTPQLLLKENELDKHKTPEFRPNIFKAALRGHTLRLLGGITDEKTAHNLTKKLWGGIPEKGETREVVIDCEETLEQSKDNKVKAIVGSIGIHFTVEGKLHEGKHTYEQYSKSGNIVTVEIPTYKLENGKLNLLKVGEVKAELEQLIINLVKFSVLLGGFGKSWRRTHHKLFYPNYFSNNNKPMIGCHWEFAQVSEELYIPVSDLSNITEFINNIREQVTYWVQSEVTDYQPNSYVQNWREAWHPQKVQVWVRFAENGKSQAVQWFHDTNRLKGSPLAGKLGQIGRIWHRMYPRYVIQDGKLTCLKGEYVEILTIFSDESNQSQQFLHFLSTENSGFKPIW